MPAMTLEELQERARAYHQNPEYYHKRNADMREMAKKRGGQVAAAKKYGVTKQCVNIIINRRAKND